MKTQDFVYWLDGFLDRVRVVDLSVDQVKLIRDKLDKVIDDVETSSFVPYESPTTIGMTSIPRLTRRGT